MKLLGDIIIDLCPLIDKFEKKMRAEVHNMIGKRDICTFTRYVIARGRNLQNVSFTWETKDYISEHPNNQTPVVQRVDSAIRWINHYPADKCYQN